MGLFFIIDVPLVFDDLRRLQNGSTIHTFSPFVRMRNGVTHHLEGMYRNGVTSGGDAEENGHLRVLCTRSFTKYFGRAIEAIQIPRLWGHPYPIPLYSPRCATDLAGG